MDKKYTEDEARVSAFNTPLYFAILYSQSFFLINTKHTRYYYNISAKSSLINSNNNEIMVIMMIIVIIIVVAITNSNIQNNNDYLITMLYTTY